MKAERLETEIGIQRRCTKCKYLWPEDTDFFYRDGKGFFAACRACKVEETRKHRSKTRQPAAQHEATP